MKLARSIINAIKDARNTAGASEAINRTAEAERRTLGAVQYVKRL